MMAEKSFTGYHVEAWDVLQHLFQLKNINDHTLHFVATFMGRLNFIRMKQSVTSAMDIFPLIRCGFNESKRQPYWENKGYTSDEMVNVIETTDSNKNIMDFLCKEADTVTGPQLKILIVRAEKNDTLCITINHMLCDAAGFKDFLYLLSSIYTGSKESPAFSPLAAMRNRKIKQLLKTFSMVDKLKIYLGKNDMSIHDRAMFHFEGSIENPFMEMRTISRDRFYALKAYATSHSATVNDIMLTALHRVLFQIFGHVVTVPCTMDLRKYLSGHKADGICNLVTNVNCDIGHELGETFDDTLRKVNSSMNKEKANNECIKSLALMEMLFNHLPYKTAQKIIDKNFINPPIAFTNIGILDKKRLIFGTAEMTGAYMTGSIKYSPYFQLALSTFDNEVTLSINLYGSQSDREQISAFLDKFVLELQGIM